MNVDFENINIGDRVTLEVTGVVTGKHNSHGRVLHLEFDDFASDVSVPAEGVIRLEPIQWRDGDQVLVGENLWERRNGLWYGFTQGVWYYGTPCSDTMIQNWVLDKDCYVVRRGGEPV